MLASESPPVRSHSNLQHRVAKNCCSPLDGVDLGNQRSVDQPCVFEQVVIVPLGIRRLQCFADRVVLQREQREEHLQSNPPSRQRSALQLNQGLRVRVDEMVLAQLDLSVDA